MAIFNFKAIIQKVADSRAATKEVDDIINDKFKVEKQDLIDEFNSHPVTQEIESGETNISNTLGGVGNLRGFIGFPEGSDPIEPVREVLDKELSVSKTADKTVLGITVKYKYKVNIPTESIAAASRIPWEPGLSWVYGIENGRIAGLAYFLQGKFNSPPSRSAEGLQAKKPVRSADFQPVPYLNSLFEKLQKSFS